MNNKLEWEHQIKDNNRTNNGLCIEACAQSIPDIDIHEMKIEEYIIWNNLKNDTTYSEQQNNESYDRETVHDIQTKLIKKSQLNLVAKNKIFIEPKTTEAFKATGNHQKKKEHMDFITHSEAFKSINSNADQGIQIGTRGNNKSENQFQYSREQFSVPFQVNEKI